MVRKRPTVGRLPASQMRNITLEGRNLFQSHPMATGGPMSTPAQPLSESDSKLWAMLAHLSGIVLLVVGPLIVLLVQGPKDANVKRQATEALNWQIVVAIGVLASIILTFLVIGAILLPIVIIVGDIFMVIGGIKAYGGEDYRYPFNWRIVK